MVVASYLSVGSGDPIRLMLAPLTVTLKGVVPFDANTWGRSSILEIRDFIRMVIRIRTLFDESRFEF